MLARDWGLLTRVGHESLGKGGRGEGEGGRWEPDSPELACVPLTESQ